MIDLINHTGFQPGLSICLWPFWWYYPQEKLALYICIIDLTHETKLLKLHTKVFTNFYLFIFPCIYFPHEFQSKHTHQGGGSRLPYVLWLSVVLVHVKMPFERESTVHSNPWIHNCLNSLLRHDFTLECGLQRSQESKDIKLLLTLFFKIQSEKMLLLSSIRVKVIVLYQIFLRLIMQKEP